MRKFLLSVFIRYFWYYSSLLAKQKESTFFLSKKKSDKAQGKRNADINSLSITGQLTVLLNSYKAVAFRSLPADQYGGILFQFCPHRFSLQRSNPNAFVSPKEGRFDLLKKNWSAHHKDFLPGRSVTHQKMDVPCLGSL